MSAAVFLCNPKNPTNVGGVLRAAACFGARELWWSGNRVQDGGGNAVAIANGSKRISKKEARLPREERHRAYQHVRWAHDEGALDRLIEVGFTPVCIEVLPQSESLADFDHPEDAVYVFGPEDGDVPKGVRHACHRFVTIPCDGCLNLAAAANITLYDRVVKAGLTRNDLSTRYANRPREVVL